MSRSGSQPRELVADAQSIGVSVSRTQVQIFEAYLDLLYVWNQRVQLTSVVRGDASRLHILDSLTTLPFVGQASSVADLGTGAGLPGLVVAIARPDVHVTLVESRRKRCTFLANAVRELRLANVTIVHGDAHAMVERVERYDLVVSRAFLAPHEFVRLAAPLARAAGGRVLVMLGRPSPTLLADLGCDCGLIRIASRQLCLPGGEERRQLIALAHASTD